MNFQDKLRARTEALRTLSLKYKVVIGAVRLNSGNTFEHELAKMLVCWRLANEGHEFITEAVFANGSRADIVDVSDLVIYEVLSSETEEECKKKWDKYPELFWKEMVRAKQEVEAWSLR